MASVIVDTATATADSGGSLESDSLPVVDLRLLSQSELYSLSLCSSAAFDPRRFDDVVIPTIDRSVFNESAGSRKQTYSRLRLAPPSSSPSTVSARRRTLHLRPASSSFADVNSSDPENAQIVTLLKQLLSFRDMDPGSLFMVKIDYTNGGLAGHKRKRGRPPTNGKLESAVVVSADGVDGNSSLSEILVHEEKDGEVTNADGVAVDLAALGSVEHPYEEEMKRRTHGLETEEELLEFLKGLSGQWGSRRKKKRIVDASEFGTALPVGWKLLLSVKKKNGGAHLYCRRYISPSGLHFVSCKEVSLYLLSLQGVQDTATHNSIQYNGIDSDDKLTSRAISDTTIHDGGVKDNPTSHVPSPTLGSASSNHEMQVEIGAGVLLESSVEDIIHCNKCNANFKGRDELLQHESSVHSRNRHKNSVRITDGVIIKDGKYECQFCHKTFSERRRYNGHVGAAHVRYQAKTAGESHTEAVDPSSFGSSEVRETMVEESIKSDNAVVSNNALDMCSPCNKDNGHAGENEANGKMRAANEPSGVVSETNTCSVPEVILSSNENKCFHEDVLVNHNASDNIDDTSSLQVNSGILNACIEKPEQCTVGEHSLPDSNYPAEKCDVGNINRNCRTTDELKLDRKDFVDNGSVFDSFGSHVDQDKGLLISSQQHSDFGYLTCDGNSGNTSTSGTMTSILTVNPKGSTLTRVNEKARVGDNIPSVDGTLDLGKCHGTLIEGNDDVSSPNEMQHAISSVVWPCNKKENVSMKDDPKALGSLLIETGPQSTSTRMHVALSVQKDLCGNANDKDEVCERKMESPKFDNLQNFADSESTEVFSRSCTGLNSSSVTGSVQDKVIGVYSDFTSAVDEQFFTEERMTRIFYDGSYEPNKELTKGMELGGSGVLEISNEAYELDKIYATTPSSPSKLIDTETTEKTELSLSFVNHHMEPCREYNQVEDGAKFQSVIDKTFAHGYLKEASPFEIGLPPSCFNYRTHEHQSSLHVPNPEGDWNGTRGTSGQDFMVGFENNSQFGGYAKVDGSSGPHLEHVVQGAPCPQMPSSSYFNSCGLISDKDKEGLFSMNSYDIRTDMSSPAGFNPVEYSFMGEQSSSSLPEESKVFSSNVDMKQGLDPGFWLGKDDLTSSATNNINHVTLVCVWCRNVFFQDARQAGNQTGEIGTMCPSCSSRIPATGL
ncbi:methyl binding domain protein [Striga asiatica]|uniref:Methyl binding domain protein n=1 Tax=Striga asiatica TaxID=4170 RepID=A0A5A7R9H6_STRAF|nr:methyl binding domain protein [Striga asiatica]